MGSDDARFIQLYDAYHGHIASYCGRRANPDRLDDAVADVFLVAWRRIEDVPPGDSALPWLYGVAYKVLGSQWRGASRRKKLADRMAAIGASYSPTTEDAVIKSSESKQIHQALDRLNPTDREILLLAAWEELPQTSIAEVLGISPGAVRQRFYEARKNLTTEYNKIENKKVNTPAAQKGGRS